MSDLAALLRAHRFAFHSEDELQRGIASVGVHEQCAGRIHRDGQTESVIAYYLVSDSGSDPTVATALGLKRQQIEGVRDPDAEIVEKLEGDSGRVQKLAEAYLQQRGIAVPEKRAAVITQEAAAHG